MLVLIHLQEYGMMRRDCIITKGENRMTLKEAFYKTIELLEGYYNNHKQDDVVVSILSDLDCTVFQDGKPVDQATYDDWEKNIIPFISKGELSDNDVKLALIEFLDYYQQEFGYELEAAINYFIINT